MRHEERALRLRDEKFHACSTLRRWFEITIRQFYEELTGIAHPAA